MTASRAAAAVDGDRLRSLFDSVSVIGRTPGGGTERLAYTAEEGRAHDEVRMAAQAAGLSCEVDAAGNLLMMLAGTEPDLPAVITGSHLDSVRSGGAWDGALGVVAALEAVRALITLPANERPKRTILIAAFRSEESARFPDGYRLGSRAAAGLISAGDLDHIVDRDGTLLKSAMRDSGLNPDDVGGVALPRAFDTVVELHIDQSDELVAENCPVGVVTALTGSHRARVTVLGQAAHSGTTRMQARRDALTAAAEMVLAVESAAEGKDAVSTVGTLEVRPGSISVIPGEVVFGLDVRSVDGTVLSGVWSEIQNALARIAERRRCQLQLQPIRQVAPVPMDTQLRATLHRAAQEIGASSVDIPSHAGHDTGSFDGMARLSMLFVRNRSGISHSPEEDVDWNDAELATRVLAAALHDIASEAVSP
jgi:hydantoinase/carbamoylase family amidase